MREMILGIGMIVGLVAAFSLFCMWAAPKVAKWKTIRCDHVDEPHHDRIACINRKIDGVLMIFLLVTLLGKR